MGYFTFLEGVLSSRAPSVKRPHSSHSERSRFQPASSPTRMWSLSCTLQADSRPILTNNQTAIGTTLVHFREDSRLAHSSSDCTRHKVGPVQIGYASAK